MRGIAILALAVAACTDEPSTRLGDWGFVYPVGTRVVPDRSGGFATVMDDEMFRFDTNGDVVERVPLREPRDTFDSAAFGGGGTIYTLDRRWHESATEPGIVEFDDYVMHVIRPGETITQSVAVELGESERGGLLAGSNTVYVRLDDQLQEFSLIGTHLGNRPAGLVNVLDEADNLVSTTPDSMSSTSIVWTNASRVVRWTATAHVSFRGPIASLDVLELVPGADGTLAIAGIARGSALDLDALHVELPRDSDYAFVAELDALGHARWVHARPVRITYASLARHHDGYLLATIDTIEGVTPGPITLSRVDAAGFGAELVVTSTANGETTAASLELHPRANGGTWAAIDLHTIAPHVVEIGERTAQDGVFVIDLDAVWP